MKFVPGPRTNQGGEGAMKCTRAACYGVPEQISFIFPSLKLCLSGMTFHRQVSPSLQPCSCTRISSTIKAAAFITPRPVTAPRPCSSFMASDRTIRFLTYGAGRLKASTLFTLSICFSTAKVPGHSGGLSRKATGGKS